MTDPTHAALAEEQCDQAELLPCPFCGEPGVIEHSYHEDDNRYPRDFWHVKAGCSSCGVSPTGWSSYGNQEQSVANFHVKQAAEAHAIAAWNLRQQPEQARDEPFPADLAEALAVAVRSTFSANGGDVAGGITAPMPNGRRYVVLPLDQYEADLNSRFERGKKSAALSAQPAPREVEPVARAAGEVVANVASAILLALYGVEIDPFQEPEKWEFGEKLAQAALSAHPTAAPERGAIAAWLRNYADEDRYGPRWRPLHYAAAAIERGDFLANPSGAVPDGEGEGA